MRKIWRIFVRTIFWSFERGTWPYDVAVAVIVIFVLLSPRSWFHDRPPVGPPPNAAMVQLQSADPATGVQTYRVNADLLPSSTPTTGSRLEHELHETLSKNISGLPRNGFQILRIDPVRGGDGVIADYDVSIKP
jgi:hypothetical protein